MERVFTYVEESFVKLKCAIEPKTYRHFWIISTRFHVAGANEFLVLGFGVPIAKLVTHLILVQIAAHFAYLGARTTGLGALQQAKRELSIRP